MPRRRKKKGGIANLGLSFLDCICCGFGAVILLFVLTMGAQTKQVRGVNESLNEILQKRLEMLAAFQSETDVLQQETAAQEVRLSKVKEEREDMAKQIADLARQIAEQEAGQEALLVEMDDMRDFIAARQKKIDVIQRESPDPVGIPVESNYLIFVIDTSGSMRDQRTGGVHGYVVQTIDETLRVYPKVEGIQVLDSSGNYIIRQSNGRWLDDSTETRTAIGRAIRSYPVFSVSNPVPGIIRAIRTFSEPENEDVQIGIYVFGDEFDGRADRVLDRLEVINPEDEEGIRAVRINAVGFPNLIFDPVNFGETGVKYANLMREVTYQHGGAFIGMRHEAFLEMRIPGIQGAFTDLATTESNRMSQDHPGDVDHPIAPLF